jgi:hypothetical protein
VFEEYLADATFFLSEARRAKHPDDEDVARRNYRAALIVGVAAMETFINYIAVTFETAGEQGLQPYELALLLDKRFGQDDGRFGIQSQPHFSRLEDKLRFLIQRFPIELALGTSVEWGQFMRFKGLRDSIVHPKKDEDDTLLNEYDSVCSRGISASIELMRLLSKGIFGKPLRAKVVDLTPTEET